MTSYSPRDEWLAVIEAAPLLGCSASKVRSLIWDGRLKASQHTPGGKYQIRRSECDRYLDALESSSLTALPA